jgi:hypothetical protein
MLEQYGGDDSYVRAYLVVCVNYLTDALRFGAYSEKSRSIITAT